MTIKMIAAVSLNGVIGNKDTNNLPWGFDEFPEDMAFFRKMTANATVIMGRNTFESLNRPAGLPKRRNIVLTAGWSESLKQVDVFKTIDAAIEYTKICGDTNIWLIGGSFVYQKGLEIADEIYLTTIPKTILNVSNIYFPFVNPDTFTIKDRIELNKEKNLYVNVFHKV